MEKIKRILMLLIFVTIIIVSGIGYFLIKATEKAVKRGAETDRITAETSRLSSERWITYRDVEKGIEFNFPEKYRLQWGVNGVLLKTAKQTIEMPIDENGMRFAEDYEKSDSPEEFAIERVSSSYTADGPDGSKYATMPKKYSYKNPNGFDAIELYLTIVDVTYLEEGKTIEKRTEVPIYIVSLSQEPYRRFLVIRFLDHNMIILEKEMLKKIADSVKAVRLP